MDKSGFSLRTTKLRKVFEKTVAVDSLDLNVKAGSVTALLGGNGAGKTTTISMLLGVLTPTSGSIELLGRDFVRERLDLLKLMNFSSPYVDLPNRLTVRQNLTFFGHLYNVPKLKARILDLAEQLQIVPFLDRPHGSLSAGQKTRATLAKSLLNKPQILLLDEPTASLDPDTADWVRTLLMDYQKQTGATLFMASHNMYEVERMADDVIMMRQGRIVTQGSPAQLLESYDRDNLEEVFLDIARNRNA